MLDAVPDLRPTLKTADPEEPRRRPGGLDVTADYDKPGRTLELAATVTPELGPENEPDRAAPGRGYLPVAGAGFEPATFGL